MQYDAACVFVGPTLTDLVALVVNESLAMGVDVFWIESEKDVRDATISQIARLFLALYYSNDTYLLTTDGDMWNLDRQHFHTRSSDHLVQLFYANAYSYRKDIMYPICYIGAKAEVFLEIMQSVTPADTFDLRGLVLRLIELGAQRHGTQWITAGKAISPQWYYDQLLFGEAISKWHGHPDKCQMISRAPARDRIDRSAWPVRLSLHGKIDAHLLRPGFIDINWLRLFYLLRALTTLYGVSDSVVQRAITYRSTFVAMKQA